MTTKVKAGFRTPWIEWDGVEGIGEKAGVVLVDGVQVPATFTECDVSNQLDHDPNHEHCRATHGPVGFTFGFRLENGIVVLVAADDHDAPIILTIDESLTNPVVLEGDHARVMTECAGPDCESCSHWSQYTWLSFETVEELMEQLERLSRLALVR